MDIWVGDTKRDRYWPQTVCVGEWFEHKEPLVFDIVAVWLSSLHPWTMVSGFDPMWGLPINPQMKTAVQKYRKPRTRTTKLPDGAVIKLAIPLKESHTGLFTSEKTLTQDTRFEFEFPEPRNLAYVRRQVFMLRNFLSLGVGESVNVTRLIGYRKPLAGADPPIGREVEMLYRHVENVRAKEAASHHDMVFSLSMTSRARSDATCFGGSDVLRTSTSYLISISQHFTSRPSIWKRRS